MALRMSVGLIGNRIEGRHRLMLARHAGAALHARPQHLPEICEHVVGPRPALAYELEHYQPRHFERFRVKPGMTGLWQVSGRAELGFKEMLELDVEYVRRRSLRLDLWILLHTLPAVLPLGAAR